MKKYKMISISLFALAVLSAIPPIYELIRYFVNGSNVPLEPTEGFLVFSCLSCFAVFGGLTLWLKYQLTKD